MRYLLIIVFLFANVKSRGYSGDEETPAILLSNRINNEHLERTLYAVKEDTARYSDYTQGTIDRLPTVYKAVNVEHIGSTYWVIFSVIKGKEINEDWYLEFIDPHINSIQLYINHGKARVDTIAIMGMDIPFGQKLFSFKNFLYPLDFTLSDTLKVYAKIRSISKTSFIFKLRSEQNFISEAKNEYAGVHLKKQRVIPSQGGGITRW